MFACKKHDSGDCVIGSVYHRIKRNIGGILCRSHGLCARWWWVCVAPNLLQCGSQNRKPSVLFLPEAHSLADARATSTSLPPLGTSLDILFICCKAATFFINKFDLMRRDVISNYFGFCLEYRFSFYSNKLNKNSLLKS